MLKINPRIMLNAFAFMLLVLPYVAPAKNSTETTDLLHQQQARTLSFIENKGQIRDQHGNRRTDIGYALFADKINIYLGNHEIHYQWTKILKDSSYQAYRMDVELVGANLNATAIAGDEQEYYENHGLSATEQVQAHTYNTVTYKNVYPNIDWVLYTKGNELKYDFVVHKGGDARNIKLHYSNATGMEHTNTGLVATTPFGSISEQNPVTYDLHTKQLIASDFILKDNTISFAIKGRNDDIVIDPALAWSTYYGGSGTDMSLSLTLAADGSLYFCGFTASSSGIATTGAAVTTYPGNAYNAYIAKFNQTGARLWGTYEYNDQFYGITTDPNGDVYVLFDTNANPGIRSYKATGVRKWRKTYGSANVTERGADMIYYEGYLYALGVTTDTTNITTTGAYQTAFGGINDLFLMRCDTGTGNKLWGTLYGGPANDQPGRMCSSKDGHIYFCGYTNSTSGIASTGAYQTSTADTSNGFLAKFDTSGAISWATYYGGSSFDQLDAVTIDTANNIYTAGLTKSTSGISTTGAFQTSYSTSVNIPFIVKFNSSGARQWGTYFGVDAYVRGLHVSNDTVLYLLGTGLSGIPTPNGFDHTYGGSGDVYVSAFNTSGSSMLWGTYYGGSDNDNVWGSAYSNGRIFISGFTQSASGIATTGAFRTTGTNGEAFLASIVTDTTLIQQPLTTYTFCTGTSFNLPYIVSTAFAAGNVFTAQLSDATGSFASPVNIGTATATTSGNITCIIPDTTAAGTGYRLRITSTSPAYTTGPNQVSITINVTPAKPSAASNTPVCTGNTLNLSATSTTTGVSYGWTGPASFTNSTQNPVITNAALTAAGNYILTVTKNGCSAKDTETVVINQTPVKPVASSNTPVCTGTTLNLSATTTTPGVSYAWTGPGSYTASVQNPVINNAALSDAGNYIVTVTLSGCSNKDTETVLVNPSPAKPVAISNALVCTGKTLSLTATTSVTGVSYSWKGPGGFTALILSPNINNVSLAAAGDYILTATLGSCTASDTQTVVINQTPAKPVITSNTPVCTGNDINFTATTSTTGVSYAWTGPGSYTSSTQNPAINNAALTDAGDYIVTVTLSGCSAKDTETVAVNQAPAKPNASSNSPLCATTTLNLTGSSSTAGVSYSWSGPSGFTSTAQSPAKPSVTVAAAGNYILTVSVNGCTAKDTEVVVVNPAVIPSVSIAATPGTSGGPWSAITFNATPVNGGIAPVYTWRINGITVAGANTNSLSGTINKEFKANDVVCVKISSNAQCAIPDTAASCAPAITINLSIDEKATDRITIAPNPFTDELVINGIASGNTIRIVDITGRVIYTATATGQQYQVNTALFPSGTYSIQVTEADSNTSFKKAVKL